MKWQEVREMYPNQYLLVSILEFDVMDDQKIVKEVNPIRSICEQDVNKEFFRAEEGTFVYHTGNKDFIINLRRDPLMKVRRV